MKSYSQSGQDVFAWETSGNKSSGLFLDIGCNDPFVHSNTAGLEELGWIGMCVDIGRFDYSKRRARFLQADATSVIPEVERFLSAYGGTIDYLSLDADDATYDAMTRLIPFYKFKAITIEHDKYRVGPELQHKIHDFLKTFGYIRKAVDVKAPKCDGMPWSEQPYEDWYLLP